MNEITQKLFATMGPLYQFEKTVIPLHHNTSGLTKSVDFETGLFLKNFVEFLRPQTVVELGTFRGYSTAWMMAGTLQNDFGHVHAFEVFTEGAYGDMWYDRLQIPKDRFTYHAIPGGIWKFEDEVPNAIDFVFHDTEHLPGPTAKELELLLPRMKLNSVIVFDDIFYPGYEPMAFVIEKSFKTLREWSYDTLKIGHGLGIARKHSF